MTHKFEIALLVSVLFGAVALDAVGQRITNPIQGADTVQAVVCLAVNFLAARLMPPVAVLMVLWASFLFLTSSGNPGKVTAARQVLLFAVIGAGILILAPAIVALVLTVGGGPAQEIQQCSAEATATTLVNTLINIINWFSWFLAILSVGVGLYAGFLYMTSRGDPSRLAIAHRVLWYAGGGVAVAILAFRVSAIVQGIVG